MRRKHWLILVVAVLVGLGVAIARSPRFQKWSSPPVLVLPQDGEVVEMRASLREFYDVSPAIPEFAVPADQIPVFLGWLRPAMYNRDPWSLDRIDELGEIVIRTRVGKEFRLRFFWTGKNPVVFTHNGVDQFYGRWEENGGRGIDGGMILRNELQQVSEAAGNRAAQTPNQGAAPDRALRDGPDS